MTPTKQTVYSQVTIEEDYLIEQNHIQSIDGDFYLEQKGYFFTPEQLNQLLSDVIKQALEAAAEKANSFIDGDESAYIQGNVWCEVDKQSITKTFEETFKKFEV